MQWIAIHVSLGHQRKTGSGFIGSYTAVPISTGVVVESSLEYQIVCRGNYFIWGIQGASRIGKIDGLLNMCVQCINHLIGITVCFHSWFVIIN